MKRLKAYQEERHKQQMLMKLSALTDGVDPTSVANAEQRVKLSEAVQAIQHAGSASRSEQESIQLQNMLWP